MYALKPDQRRLNAYELEYLTGVKLDVQYVDHKSERIEGNALVWHEKIAVGVTLIEHDLRTQLLTFMRPDGTVQRLNPLAVYLS